MRFWSDSKIGSMLKHWHTASPVAITFEACRSSLALPYNVRERQVVLAVDRNPTASVNSHCVPADDQPDSIFLPLDITSILP